MLRPHPHKTPQIVRPHPHQAPRITHLVIGTAPAVAGFPVTVEGVTQYTDSAGKIHTDVPETSQDLRSRVSFQEVFLNVGGRPVKVTPTRLYRFTSGAQIALDLRYLVGFHFSNLAGLQGAPINTLTVRSAAGEVAALPAARSSWLLGKRAVPKDSGLEVKNIDWSVQRVTYGGSNVVNESQQRFSPATQTDVGVKLLFYSLDVHVRDALFGFTRIATVEITYPNGRPQRVELDRDGWLHLPTVPRGDYVITVLGSGPHLPLPMTMSRDERINVGFFSWLDAMTVLGVGLVLAAVPVLVGRLRRRPGRAGGQDPFQPEPDEPPNFVVTVPHENAGPASGLPVPRSEPSSSDLAAASERHSG
jgi:hypothetical protein